MKKTVYLKFGSMMQICNEKDKRSREGRLAFISDPHLYGAVVISQNV